MGKKNVVLNIVDEMDVGTVRRTYIEYLGLVESANGRKCNKNATKASPPCSNMERGTRIILFWHFKRI